MCVYVVLRAVVFLWCVMCLCCCVCSSVLFGVCVCVPALVYELCVLAVVAVRVMLVCVSVVCFCCGYVVVLRVVVL